MKSEEVMKIFAEAKIHRTYSLFTFTSYFLNILRAVSFADAMLIQ